MATWCTAPSFTRGMARWLTVSPSRVASTTPRVRRSGFDTEISYRVSRNRQTIWYSGHVVGMQGSIEKVDPARRRPRMLSTPARYIQDADPVYQLQPPRPRWLGWLYTSPATT